MSNLLLFIFGLAVGSFINVIGLRYQPNQRIKIKEIVGGRSHCPNCLKTLRWYELIPIFSFLFQKGKCRSCGQPISFQYPLVEILSGLIFVFVPLRLSSSWVADYRSAVIVPIIWIIIFLLFLLLSIIDWRHSVIPNKINLALAAGGLILLFINNYYKNFDLFKSHFLGHYAALLGLRESIWLNYAAAVSAAAVVFGTIILLSRGRAMGWGDFKAAVALGLIFGWPDILMVMFLAFISGALVSIYFLVKKKKKIKDAIPFGPFLASGAVLTFFFGYYLIDGYFKLFKLQ